MESNGKISSQLSTTVTSILEETAISKRNFLFVMESMLPEIHSVSSSDVAREQTRVLLPETNRVKVAAGLLKLDNDECEKIYSFIHPCVEDMKQMKDSHSSEVSEIAENAGKVLIDEYKVKAQKTMQV